MKPYWTRLRDWDNHWNVALHEDWVIGDCQLGYFSIRVSPATWKIVVRQKKGWFGCSKWYDVERFKLQSDLCEYLNELVDITDDTHWIEWMTLIDKREEKDKQDRLEERYCGFGVDGKITRL